MLEASAILCPKNVQTLVFTKANLKNLIYHHVTKSCCYSYVLFVFWAERKAWAERSHPALISYPLEVGSSCGGKKKLFWVLKVVENLLLPLLKEWGLIGPWQLRKCAQQLFPFSCLCLISLCGSGSCFQVVPYPTSQLDPVWLPQVWRGWEWDNRGISRLGLTWGTGKAAGSLSRSLAQSTRPLAQGLELSFHHLLLQIRKSCSCCSPKVLYALTSYVLCPRNNWPIKYISGFGSTEKLMVDNVSCIAKRIAVI